MLQVEGDPEDSGCATRHAAESVAHDTLRFASALMSKRIERALVDANCGTFSK